MFPWISRENRNSSICFLKRRSGYVNAKRNQKKNMVRLDLLHILVYNGYVKAKTRTAAIPSTTAAADRQSALSGTFSELAESV